MTPDTDRKPDRNARAQAPTVALDTTNKDETLQRQIRALYPRVIDLHWELEDGDKTGWIYSGSRVLAKIVHISGAHPGVTNEPVALELVALAREHLGIDTLAQRGSDSLDFHSVSVAGIARALQAAYDAGKAARS